MLRIKHLGVYLSQKNIIDGLICVLSKKKNIKSVISNYVFSYSLQEIYTNTEETVKAITSY